jgi:hypothetical protein
MGAVCAAVGARALLIAVGRENSEVALYRCGWAPRAEGDCVAPSGTNTGTTFDTLTSYAAFTAPPPALRGERHAKRAAGHRGAAT